MEETAVVLQDAQGNVLLHGEAPEVEFDIETFGFSEAAFYYLRTTHVVMLTPIQYDDEREGGFDAYKEVTARLVSSIAHQALENKGKALGCIFRADERKGWEEVEGMLKELAPFMWCVDTAPHVSQNFWAKIFIFMDSKEFPD